MYDDYDPEEEQQQQPQGSGLGDAAKDYATDKLKDNLSKKLASNTAKSAATKAGTSAATSAGSSAAAGAGTSAAAGAGSAAAGGAVAAGGAAAGGAAAGGAAGSVVPVAGTAVGAAIGATLGALATKLKKLPIVKELAQAAGKAFKWVMMVIFGCCFCSILLGIFLTFLPILMFLFMLVPLNTDPAEASDNADENTANQFASLDKLVSAPTLALGPAASINIKNEQLPQKLHFDINITAKSDLTGIVCTDTLTLIKKDGSTENLPVPSLGCPTTLKAGETRTFSFDFDAPNQDKFKDSTVRNEISLGAKTTDSTSTGASYYIPVRDNVLNSARAQTLKTRALTDYPKNLINAPCPGGVTCWDYVISTSRAANLNPSLILAIWYEESHFSDVGNHFSCPVTVSRPHDGTGLSQSLSCLINNIFNGTPYASNTAEGFIDAMHHYCGTGPYGGGDLCHNNPNFLSQLKGAYEELGGSVIPLGPGGGGGGTTFNLEATASVFIGEVESCYQFDSSWSEADKAAEEQAIAFLARSQSFMKLVCAAGSVNLSRVEDGTYYGVTNGAHGITIHGPDIGSFDLRLYILAHESGHVIGNENPDDFSKFRAAGILQAEGLMPTYAKDIGLPGVNCSPGLVNPAFACYDESYAEMIGAYVVYKFHRFPARGWSGYPGGVWFNNPAAAWDSFPNDRPQHFDYAENNIFGGFSY
jgi:hypothetical protein